MMCLGVARHSSIDKPNPMSWVNLLDINTDTIEVQHKILYSYLCGSNRVCEE